MLYNLIYEGQPIHVLQTIPNHHYYALHLVQGEVKASPFPFFLFVEFNGDKYFVPALAEIINNISYAFTNYICYVGELATEAPPGLTKSVDVSFNPFMPTEIVNQVKQLVGVL